MLIYFLSQYISIDTILQKPTEIARAATERERQRLSREAAETLGVGRGPGAAVLAAASASGAILLYLEVFHSPHYFVLIHSTNRLPNRVPNSCSLKVNYI